MDVGKTVMRAAEVPDHDKFCYIYAAAEGLTSRGNCKKLAAHNRNPQVTAVQLRVYDFLLICHVSGSTSMCTHIARNCLMEDATR